MGKRVLRLRYATLRTNGGNCSGFPSAGRCLCAWLFPAPGVGPSPGISSTVVEQYATSSRTAQLLDSSRKYGEHGRMKTIAVHGSEPVRSTTLADLDPVSVGRVLMPLGIDDDLLGEMLDHDRP